jgi:hypothetical protein
MRDGEALQPLAERLFMRLATLLHRVIRRQTEISLGVKRRHGRPKDDLPPRARPSANKRGAREKLTPDVEQWFLSEIDTWKGKLAASGLKARDSTALRLSVAAYYVTQISGEKPSRAAWVAAIARLTANKSTDDHTITLARAAILHARRVFTEAHAATGLPRDEAKRRAHRTTLALADLFRTRKGTLSRLRKQGKPARR